MSVKNYIIASDRKWNKELPKRLGERCEGVFYLVENKDDFNATRIHEINPRYIFLPHWSYRIPPEIYEKYECVIFHMTDVPYGRGGSPLQNLIVRGHTETVISALNCVEDMDAGPVYLKQRLALFGSAEEIFLRASAVVENMIEQMVCDEPEAIPQQGEPVVFKRRRPDDGNIIKSKNLDQVYDMIRMLDAEGYPRAFIDFGNFRIEFERASRRANGVRADVFITLREDNER